MNVNSNNPQNNYYEFNSVILSNTPLDSFTPGSNSDQTLGNITPASFQQQQMILDFFLNQKQKNSNTNFSNNNVDTTTNNDYITEFDIQKILDTTDINQINSRISYSSNKTDYLKSSPLPFVSQGDFDYYYNTSFDSKDLTSLEHQIDKLSSNSDLKQNIGPFSSLDHLIELAFKGDPKSYNQMINKRHSMESHIYKWRKVKGDGNCFYRATIFSFIESIILNNNQQLLINLIMDIKACYETKLIQSKLNIKHGFLLKYATLIKILVVIYTNMRQNNIKKAYDIFIKCILACEHFDYGLILYLRYILYRYTIDNETKLYTETFPVLIGNLLPSEYETEEGKFLFLNYYENYLLKMFKDAEKIVIYLIPFVLCTKLNVVLFDTDQDSLKEFNYYGMDNHQCHYSINISNIKVHYELIYTIESYEAFSAFFDSHQLSQKYVNTVLPMKPQENNQLHAYANNINSARNVDNNSKSQTHNINSAWNNEGNHPIFSLFDFVNEDINDVPRYNQSQTYREVNNKPHEINKQSSNNHPLNKSNEPIYHDAFSPEYHEKVKHSLIEFMNNSTSEKNKSHAIEENDYPLMSNSNYQNQSRQKSNNDYNDNYYQQLNINESSNSKPSSDINIYQFYDNSSNNSKSKSENTQKRQGPIHVKPINDSNYTFNQPKAKEVEYTKCLNCNLAFLGHNQYTICQNCLLNEIKTNLLSLYFSYLSNAKEMSLTTNTLKIGHLFISIFKNRGITIKGHQTKIEDALACINIDRQETITLNDLLKELKASVCLSCEKDLKSSSVVLPCGCCFCSLPCELMYFKSFNLIVETQTQKKFICLCNHSYSPRELIVLISQLAFHILPKAKEYFKLFIKKVQFSCLFCEKNLVNDCNVIKIECRNMPLDIERYLKVTKLEHSVCIQCYQQLRINPSNFYCSLCGIMHEQKQNLLYQLFG